METNFGYCDKDNAFFSSDERRWITKIRKLKAKHPDQIEILAEPETNDGCIYCKLPSSWLKVIPPRVNVMSEEQKATVAARLAQARVNRQN